MFQKRGANRGGRGSAYRSGNEPRKPRGSFENGVWHCDCDPKLPAEHFRVKKEGPNKGRWFYTCQKQQDERCGFFLWDEDAEPRMQAALLNNTNSEPAAQGVPTSGPQVGASTALHHGRNEAQRTSISPPPPYTPVAVGKAPEQPPVGESRTRKRTLPWDSAEDDSETDGEALPWPPTAEDQPVQLGSSRAAAVDPPSTPRKAARTTATVTPGSRSRQDGGDNHGNSLPTPMTTTRTGWSTEVNLGQITGQDTPTPARFHDVLATSPSKPGEDIAPAVMTFLSSNRIQLQPDVASGLRSILDTHTQQVRGLTKGRDIAREAIKTRDSKISELTLRIDALEGDLELYRARVRSIKEHTTAD